MKDYMETKCVLAFLESRAQSREEVEALTTVSMMLVRELLAQPPKAECHHWIAKCMKRVHRYRSK